MPKAKTEAKFTAKQYIAACRKLDLSPTYGAAKALGISQPSAARYASGRQPIPEVVARLLRAYLALTTLGLVIPDA